MYLSDMIADVRLYVPSVVPEQAMLALQRGAVRFFRDSTLWRDTRTYTLRTGTDSFKLAAPSDEAAISAVKGIRFGGWEVPMVDRITFSQYQGVGSHPEVACVDLRAGVIRIAPTPTATQDNVYVVTSVIIPSADADELDVDSFAAEFQPAILAAALSTLFTIPVFMDANAATVQESMYLDAVIRAQNKAEGLLDGEPKVVKYGGL